MSGKQFIKCLMGIHQPIQRFIGQWEIPMGNLRGGQRKIIMNWLVMINLLAPAVWLLDAVSGTKKTNRYYAGKLMQGAS